MKLNDVLQQARPGQLFGRRAWPTSKVLCIDAGIRVDETIQWHGEAVHPLQPGRPPYRPTAEDQAANDWAIFE